MNHKNNRRSASTKARIRSSLLALLKEQPLNRITVRHLCEHAQINRSTFYNHYSSPMEILAEIKTEFLSSITTILKNSKSIHESKVTKERIESFMYDILIFLEEHKEICLILKDSDVVPTIGSLILNDSVIQEFFSYNLSDTYTEEEFPYVYQYIQFGGFRLLDFWLINECATPAADVAKLLASLISRF